MPTSRRRFVKIAAGAIVAGSAAAVATRRAHSDTPPPPFRAHFGAADLFVPSEFRTRTRTHERALASVSTDGATFDLVLHQHGVLAWQEGAFARAHVNAVLVSVNLGEGSGHYERWARDPRALDTMIASVEREMQKSGRAAGAKVGRVALSGWSAGFGGVGVMLAQPAIVQRIDAVLLEDGLHTSYVGAYVPDRAVLAKYASFAELAKKKEKLFAITHSAVRAPGYASTTETVSALLDMIGVAKVVVTAPRGTLGVRAIYEAHANDFHALGFAGGGVEEHRDHVRRMDETLLPLLADRWKS